MQRKKKKEKTERDEDREVNWQVDVRGGGGVCISTFRRRQLYNRSTGQNPRCTRPIRK